MYESKTQKSKIIDINIELEVINAYKKKDCQNRQPFLEDIMEGS